MRIHPLSSLCLAENAEFLMISQNAGRKLPLFLFQRPPPSFCRFWIPPPALCLITKAEKNQWIESVKSTPMG